MKNISLLIYSVLIFLVSLFLFQVILYALGVVLLFLVLSTLAEIIWSYRNSLVHWSIIKTTLSIILSASLAISIYSLIFLSIDFCLTEVFMVTPKLPSISGIVLLITLIILFSFTNCQSLFKNKNAYLLLLFYLFLSGIFYLGYRNKKLALEYLPKIYRISDKWGIQGMMIKISGVNLFPVWKQGQIFVGENKMNIISWSEKEIISEVPVPGNFGLMELKVIREDGVISNSLPFELRDPSFLNEVN